MREHHDLQREFDALKSEVTSIIDTAKRENRDLTEAERASNEQRFARMEDLRAEAKRSERATAWAHLTGRPVAEFEPFDSDSIKTAITTSPVPASFVGTSNPGVFSIDPAKFVREPRPLKPTESLFSAMRLNEPAVSLGRLMQAMVTGPRNEAERFALQSGSDSTGGYELPPVVAAQFIDGWRSQSAYVRAGALILPMFDRHAASRVSDATASFRAEDASVSAGAPFERVDMTPKNLNTVVKVSREQLEDSINIALELERTLHAAVAKAADAAIGFGTSNGPTGIASTTGVLEVDAAGPILNYSPMLDALYELQSNNGDPTAAIVSPRESRTINGFTDDGGQPLRRPDVLASLPMLVTPSSTDGTILVGDFTRLLIAVRVSLRVEVLRERFADNNQYGYLATLRLDALPTRVKSFCKITGITTAGASSSSSGA